VRHSRRIASELSDTDPALSRHLPKALAADDSALVAAAARLVEAEDRVALLRDRRDKVRWALVTLGYDPDDELALLEDE
jgi:hypothetical protein